MYNSVQKHISFIKRINMQFNEGGSKSRFKMYLYVIEWEGQKFKLIIKNILYCCKSEPLLNVPGLW